MGAMGCYVYCLLTIAKSVFPEVITKVMSLIAKGSRRRAAGSVRLCNGRLGHGKASYGYGALGENGRLRAHKRSGQLVSSLFAGCQQAPKSHEYGRRDDRGSIRI